MNSQPVEKLSRPAAPGFFQSLIAPHSSLQEIGARRRAQLLATLSLIVGSFLIVGLIIGSVMATSSPSGILALAGLILAALLSYIFSRTRWVLVGSLILTLSLAASAYWLIWNHEDPQRSLITVVPLALILGSVLLPFWGIALLSGAVVIATFLLLLIVPGLDVSSVVTNGGAFLVMGAAFLAVTAFRNSLEQRRLDEINKANRELQDLQSTLEKQVVEQTHSLEQRNVALQVINEFARLTSQAREEAVLIDQSVHLLGELYHHGHIGIFLVDDLNENAILSASNSPEGAALLAEHFQLKISVGDMTALVSEVDIQTYHFGRAVYRVSRPTLLRGKQANFTFPIAVGERLLGILNIQTAADAPAVLETTTLQAFADQIALSIQNIRLMAQLQGRITEVSKLAAQTVRTSWDRIRQGRSLGYNYDQLHILPASESFPREITRQLQAGQTSTYSTAEDPPRARLVAPIVLREEVIGVIGYDDQEPAHEWQPEEIALLETIAARVALALENTRLVDEAQLRAEREQMLGQVSSHLRASLDIDTVLQTAVQELKKSLNLEQAEVRLQMTGSRSDEKRRSRKEAEGNALPYEPPSGTTAGV